MLTINQIVDQVKDLADAHHQIAEVGVGTIAELQASERSYPLLWISHEQGSLQDNYKINNLRLTVFDRVLTGQEGQDDTGHEQEVLSDTETILLDFLNYFHQNHSQDYITVKSANLEHFTERTNDRTAGWSTVLELRQFYDWNKCQIPESGASISPSVDGLTLYDFCDAATVARLTSAQRTCLEAELCGVPDPATITINGASLGATGSVASGASLDIDVNFNGTPAGSWDGDSWEITSLALSVAASTTTPALGDSVTITATPTNITPTSYTFYLPKIDGTIETVTQAGNSYVWTAEGNGAVEVTVSATDGSDTVHSCVEVTVDFPFVADDHASMSFSYGLFKAASAYSGNCFQVQRSSDGAYLEVGWVNGCVADLASLRTWAGADEVKVTIWYDSTGNGNHLVQATAGEQVPISNYGGIQLLDNGLQFRDDVGFDMTSGGTNTPIGAARIDLYTVMEVRDFTIGIYTLFNRRTNSGFMMIGQSGSGANAYSNFGTPSYYVDGSAIGTTRGDVYTALYQTGVKQVSVLNGDTTNGDWSIDFRIGELDFNTHWVGTQSTLWAWVTDTSSIRSTIESKINALQALDVD